MLATCSCGEVKCTFKLLPPPSPLPFPNTNTHTAHIQSLGETHVDLSPAAVLPPVPPQAGESHDSSHDPQTISVVSHVHDPQGGPQLVLKDGDIMDDVIEDIVAQATSSSSSSEDEAEDTTG